MLRVFFVRFWGFFSSSLFNIVAIHYPNLSRECFCLTYCLFLRRIGLIRWAKRPFYGCATQLLQLQLAKGASGAGIISLPRRLLWPLGRAGMSEWAEGVPEQGSGPCGGQVHLRLTRAERKTFCLKVTILMWMLFSFTFESHEKSKKGACGDTDHPVHNSAHHSTAEGC